MSFTDGVIIPFRCESPCCF